MNLPILMYHKIQTPELDSDLAVSAMAFEEQMTWLKKKGYTSISLATLEKGLRQPEVLPSRPVVITFDDAYQSVFDTARPILKKVDFQATVFVVPEAIGKDNLWDQGNQAQRSACMDLDAIQTLLADQWEIGSHGFRHLNLMKLDDRQLTEELVGSKTALEKVCQQPITTFCYPFGACDQRARHQVEQAGYTMACAISPGTASVTADLLALRRVYVKPSDTMSDFQRKISKWYLWYRSWRKR